MKKKEKKKKRKEKKRNKKTNHLFFSNNYQGLEKHGVGKWKKIFEDPDFTFPPHRNPVSLKDKYRNMWEAGDIN